jgi:hypothetical protein
VLDYYSTSDTGMSGTPIVDVTKIGVQRGRADFDVRQRFTPDGLWYLPSPWKHGFGSALLGNWRLGTTGRWRHQATARHGHDNRRSQEP